MPSNSLVGGGFFQEYFELRVSEAWQIWARGNGVNSEADLLSRVQEYRVGRRFEHDPDHRCAITGSRTYPSLEAAHIRDYASEGGVHAVSNALLLRSDVHALYDRGYLGIDPDLRLHVSPELKINGWNGVEFYEREANGFRIAVPANLRQQPDRDALAWHYETTFRAA
jgi:predicted restriction endonuclease